MTRFKAASSVFLILAVLLSTLLTADLPPAGADEAGSGSVEAITPELAAQLAELYRQKKALSPAQRKIDSGLLDFKRKAETRVSIGGLHGGGTDLRDLATSMIRCNAAGDVRVEISVSGLNEDRRRQLEGLGMEVKSALPEYGRVEGTLPYGRLEAVAGLDFVKRVGTPAYAIYNTGSVTSAGDTVLRAAEARSAFGVDGSGIKIGVMSDGVDHLADSVATGDLPSGVEVIQEGSGDEGTAMLEIIHDLAPGAELAFFSPNSSDNMVGGIGAFEDASCDIIVDDLTFLDEPKFEDGPIANRARQFVADGGVYVTSAGNSADKHYMGQYVRAAEPGLGYPYAHDYNADPDPEEVDIGNTFNVSGKSGVKIVLQWNNRWDESSDDFDLALIDVDDSIAYISSNRQDSSGIPYEYIEYYNSATISHTVFIAILEFNLVSEPSDLLLDYTVYYGSGLEYNTASNSLLGHAAVEEVLSTAAVDSGNPGNVEWFSSRGPGTIYFPSQEDRQVPNITGTDRVATTAPGFADFWGTSAAAPHVAAVAALLWDADPTLTSQEVRDAITSTAYDIEAAGFDLDSGWGRADAYEAIASITPVVETHSATYIDLVSGELHGQLIPTPGISANVSFHWGNASDNLSHETMPQTMASPGAFSANLSSLDPSTTYYFQAKAVGGSETVYGATANFTTKELASIDVITATPFIDLGRPAQFVASGVSTDNITADITSSANWSSSNTTVATINAAGLAATLAEGSANITATYGAISDKAILTVGPAVLDAINVTPVNPTVVMGVTATLQFSASGVFSNGTVDVTASASWTSDNVSVASVNGTSGLAVIVTPGQAEISAAFGGKSGNTTLTVQAAPQGPGGGGGGGGGGSAIVGETRRTSLLPITSSSLILIEDAEAPSVDEKLSLFIARGTRVVNSLDAMLTSVVIETVQEPPDAPPDTVIIGEVYDVGPSGARFDPAASLTISYDPDALPAGVSPDRLYIALWNEETQSWERLESGTSLEGGGIVALVAHLSVYALMVDTRPASFEVSGLSVSPARVDPGRSVSISVLIANTGDMAGQYSLGLKLDDDIAQTKDLSLAGGESEEVSFVVSAEGPGTHTISVGGLSGTFEVAAPEPPTTPSTSTIPASPARFSLSSLSVSPAEVHPSEMVTVSLTVANTGGTAGSYAAVLKINGTEEATRELVVGPGEEQAVSFNIAREAEGIYGVDVGGRSGQFSVVTAPPVLTTSTSATDDTTSGWILPAVILVAVAAAIGLPIYIIKLRRRPKYMSRDYFK